MVPGKAMVVGIKALNGPRPSCRSPVAAGGHRWWPRQVETGNGGGAAVPIVHAESSAMAGQVGSRGGRPRSRQVGVLW